MDVIDKAHEAIARGSVTRAVKLIAGESAPKRKAVVETLKLALRLDEQDKEMIRSWMRADGRAE